MLKYNLNIIYLKYNDCITNQLGDKINFSYESNFICGMQIELLSKKKLSSIQSYGFMPGIYILCKAHQTQSKFSQLT